MLHAIADHYGGHNTHLIVGDFNARLLERLPAESEHIGQHVFKISDYHIEDMPQPQAENRELFIEFCMEADYVVSNTWFQKNQEDLLRFRNTDTVAFQIFQPLYTNARLAQIDYVLTNKPWKNSVKSVHTTAHATIESDHKLLVAKLEMKLAIKEKRKDSTSAQISQIYRRIASSRQQSDSRFFLSR